MAIDYTPIVSGVGTLSSIGFIFFYMKAIRKDTKEDNSIVSGAIKEVAKDLAAFKNGHFKEHMEEAEKRGLEQGRREGTENLLKTLHDRLDKVEVNKV